MPERTCRGDAWHAAHTPEELERRNEKIRQFHRENPGVFKGTNNPRAKLTEDDVREIRRTFAAGELSSPKLAAKYGVSKPVILSVVHRKTWAHVE
jgi:hypothetical protein